MQEVCQGKVYMYIHNVHVIYLYVYTLLYLYTQIQDIRSLDKEMRAWDVFSGLDSAVKNMVTSLRAVGELQNPAIRDRHWLQLMQATQVQCNCSCFNYHLLYRYMPPLYLTVRYHCHYYSKFLQSQLYIAAIKAQQSN